MSVGGGVGVSVSNIGGDSRIRRGSGSGTIILNGLSSTQPQIIDGQSQIYTQIYNQPPLQSQSQPSQQVTSIPYSMPGPIISYVSGGVVPQIQPSLPTFSNIPVQAHNKSVTFQLPPLPQTTTTSYLTEIA